MKTAIFSLITATALGFASIASGRSFDAADFITIAFSTGLVAWTVSQYSRSPRPLVRNRPIRVTMPVTHAAPAKRQVRVAA